MKYIPKAVSRAVFRSALQTQKHSPRLLFVTGLVGVVATAVLASKATLKLEETLDELEQLEKVVKGSEGAKLQDGGTYSENDQTKDLIILQARKIMAVGRLYAPAIAVGVISVGCLTGAHVILDRRNVALTAAYAGLEKAYKGYRQRVSDAYGEERELELHHGVHTKETFENTKNGPKLVTTQKIVDGTRSPYARFFDECCKGWNPNPEYNLVFVRCQQNYANDLLLARGHVFLNEVYDMLGMERTKAGAVVGWVLDDGGDRFIDFGMYENRPAARDFVNGREPSILLDFNVDGIIYDKI